MPLNAIGKILYPNLQPWERRRKLATVLWVLVASLAFASCVAVMIYVQDHKLR
jgi:hypothetical protein